MSYLPDADVDSGTWTKTCMGIGLAGTIGRRILIAYSLLPIIFHCIVHYQHIHIRTIVQRESGVLWYPVRRGTNSDKWLLGWLGIRTMVCM